MIICFLFVRLAPGQLRFTSSRTIGQYRVASSELCSQQDPITGLQVWPSVILVELPESGHTAGPCHWPSG